MAIGVAIVICALFVATANSGEIPSYIHVCKRTDPAVSKCIRESVEFIRPRLRNGIEELNVPALEPLRIADIVISRGDDGSGYRAILKDIDVFGVSDFQIKKLKLDVSNSVYRIGLVVPLLRLVGVYDINARVLVVPIKGEGKFYANATNCIVNGVLRADITNENGQKRMHFTGLDLKLQIGDYNLRLDNLFNGDAVLSQGVNNILNENKKEFIEAATPFIERKVSEIILDIANNVVKNFEYDQVFPEK